MQTPRLAVDCVVITPQGVVMIRRANPPFAGQLALPGGFVDIGETVEAACLRELEEETGIKGRLSDLRLVGVYSDPGRDPRFHTVTIAYTLRVPSVKPEAGSDAAAVELLPDPLRNPGGEALAFDHDRILTDAFRLWSEEMD